MYWIYVNILPKVSLDVRGESEGQRGKNRGFFFPLHKTSYAREPPVEQNDAQLHLNSFEMTVTRQKIIRLFRLLGDITTKALLYFFFNTCNTMPIEPIALVH